MNRHNSKNEDAILSTLQLSFNHLVADDRSYWTPHLFQTQKTPDGTISFDARQINISPQEEWKRYLVGLEKDYVSGKKAILREGFSFREYDGSAPEEGTAFHCKCSNSIIGQTVHAFAQSIANADVERGSKNMTENGFVICGKTKEGSRILFVSAHTPLVQINNRFWLLYDKTQYRPVKEKQLLTLPKKIDALIVGEDVWFLTLQGTQLFAPDSICKNVAQDRVSGMKGVKWIEGFDTFADVAIKGFNPRRFLAFNAGKVIELGDGAKRKRIAKKFSLPLKPSGNIDLSNPISANAFIKIICNKAMVDPFNEGPMEVSGAKEWNGR